MNEKIINLLAILWFLFQFIIVFIYGALIPIFGILTSIIFWQILTELGYFVAYKLGFHSTSDEKSISDGKGGRLPFPNFVSNTLNYLEKKASLTNFERVMRLIFSLSFSVVLTLYLILGIAFLSNLAKLGNYQFLIVFMICWFLSLLLWKGYQRLFAYIFRLDIAWKENNRPVFVRLDRKIK